jgi:cell division septation protein DedD
MFFLRTEASSAAEYIQLPGAVHVYSTVTSGLYSIEDLVLIAKEKGLKAIILTDQGLVAMEYGTFPLRNLVKKKVEKKSVLKLGPEQYLAMIDQINQLQKDVLVIPGVQVSPFYYWTGSLYKGNLTAHEFQKELLLVGLRSAEDYHNLPLLHRGFSTRYLKELMPQSLILLSALLLGGYLVLLKGPLKLVGVFICFFSLVLTINHHPFQSSRFDPYHGDQGIAPYQELIDYVNSRGGLTFWAHPGSNHSKTGKIGPFKLTTTPYSESLSDAKDYTGFSALYKDATQIANPGKKWDQLLNAYCRGERQRPLWGIAEANFQGDARGVKMDSYQTVFLVKNETEHGILQALAKGRVYAKQKGTGAELKLDGFRVTDKTTTNVALMGEEIQVTKTSVISGKLSAVDAGCYHVRVLLVKGGDIMQSFEGQTPIDFLFEDNEIFSGKTFYRLIVEGDKAGKIISNPIFVKKNPGKLISKNEPGNVQKDLKTIAKAGGHKTAAKTVIRQKVPDKAVEKLKIPKKLKMPDSPTDSAEKIVKDTSGNGLEVAKKEPGPIIKAPEKMKFAPMEKSENKGRPKFEKSSVVVRPLRKPYSIQVASFPSLGMAKKAIEKYQYLGLPLYYARVNLGKKGIWWRVYIGHYQTKADAMRARKETKLLESMVKKTSYANLLGVFVSKNDVAEVYRRLKESDFSPYVIKGNDKRFRLYSGAFITKKGADEHKFELQKNGLQGIVVKR